MAHPDTIFLEWIFVSKLKDEDREKSLQLAEHVIIQLMVPFLSKRKKFQQTDFIPQKFADILRAKVTVIIDTIRVIEQKYNLFAQLYLLLHSHQMYK